MEYGRLIFAAQERQRPREELIAQTPADGSVAESGEVDGNPSVAMSYDYTCSAGARDARRLKKDRLFEAAERRQLPWYCSPRAAAGDRGTWTCRSWRAWTAAPSVSSPASAAACRR